MDDFIVIGAGYGGVCAASLLQKHGKRIILVEAHALIGGCASYFRRKDFLFDVGATTFSGVLPNQPLGKIFSELDIQPALLKVDPGMIIKMHGKVISRYADSEKWLKEVNHHFPDRGMTKFWERIFHLEKLAWEFIGQNGRIPPGTFFDFVSLAKPKNLNKLQMIPELFRSVSQMLNALELKDTNFRKFLDEQLLITTQSRADAAPMLTSAMGLAYPAETYYPMGGMYRPAELMLDKFQEMNGKLILKEKVTSITREKAGYKVTTKKGNVYAAKGIISNLPIWNMAEITEGNIQKYFLSKSKKFASGPGAFTLYFAVETRISLSSLYYQIHTRSQIPFCEAGAFFVSFSDLDDRSKAPEGFRTVTISTHTDPKEWFGLTKESYENKKAVSAKFILDEFDFGFPELRAADKLFALAGTPDTFEFYTHRKNGFVGGIPHSIHSNLLFMTPNVTPFPNLYLVGDTVFPGQGVPSVALGALNVVNRILR